MHGPHAAPLCRQCGGVWTNPAAVQCRFCGWHVATQAMSHRSAMPQPGHRGIPGGETSFFWLRIAAIAIAIGMSVLGACVSALAG